MVRFANDRGRETEDGEEQTGEGTGDSDRLEETEDGHTLIDWEVFHDEHPD